MIGITEGRLADWTYRAYLDGRDVTCYLSSDTRISWGRLTRADQPEASTCTLVMRDEQGAVNPLIGQRVGVDAVYQGTAYPRFRGTVSSAEVGTGYDEVVVVASGPFAKLGRTMVDIPWSAEFDGDRIERILTGETTGGGERLAIPTTTGYAEYFPGDVVPFPTSNIVVLSGLYKPSTAANVLWWTAMSVDGFTATPGTPLTWVPVAGAPWIEGNWVDGATADGFNALRVRSPHFGPNCYWWSTIHEDADPRLWFGQVGSPKINKLFMPMSTGADDPSHTYGPYTNFDTVELEARNLAGYAGPVGGVVRFYCGPALDLTPEASGSWTWSPTDVPAEQQLAPPRASLVTYGTRALGSAESAWIGLTLESAEPPTMSAVTLIPSTHGTRPTLGTDPTFPTGGLEDLAFDVAIPLLPAGIQIAEEIPPAALAAFNGGLAKGWEIRPVDGTRVALSGFEMVMSDPSTPLAGDIDDGWVTIAERTIVSGTDTRSKLDLMREAAIAALGIVLERFDGTIEYQSAMHRQPRAEDMVLDCVHILKEMRWRDDIADLLNDLAYTYGNQHHADAATFKGRVQDAGSIAEFGTYGANQYLALSNGTDAAMVANQLIAWRKQPFWTMETLPVRLETVPDVALALTLHISALLELTNIPEPTPANTGLWWLEGAEEVLSVRGWTAGWYISPFDTSVIPA